VGGGAVCVGRGGIPFAWVGREQRAGAVLNCCA